MTATTSYIIRDYDTTAVLLGEPTAELISESYAEGNYTGVVLAERDAYGVWQYVPESQRTADSLEVYVEAV